MVKISVHTRSGGLEATRCTQEYRGYDSKFVQRPLGGSFGCFHLIFFEGL